MLALLAAKVPMHAESEWLAAGLESLRRVLGRSLQDSADRRSCTMNNAQWLYAQVPGPDDEDEGVHLTSAHALQIAGELTRGAEALGKLDAMTKRAEAAEGDWQHVERKWQQAKDLLRALVIALRSGASTDEILETINEGAGITVPPEPPK